MNLTDIVIDAFEEVDKNEFISLLGDRLSACYVYSRGMIVKGKRELSCFGRPVFRGGEIYVSAELFAYLVGGRVENLRLFVGDASVDLSTVPTSSDGQIYVSVIGTAEHFGLFGKAYNGRLAIIGVPEDVERFDEAVRANPRLAYAGSAVTVGSSEDAELSHADFEIAKKNWRESIVGSPALNDLSDSDIKKKIETVSQKCLEKWQTMNKGEGIPKLWGDTPPVESCELREQYGGILAMAKGYATFGSRFYQNPELACDIKYAFRWMYENMYGEAELEGRGWRSMQAFNWWDWRVGCGEILTDAMMITDELFSYEEKKRYLKVLEYVLDYWRVGDTQNFAAGRMSLGPKTAILLEDTKRISRAVKDYHIMLEIRLAGEGTRTDYGNYQHGFPYNIMYGLNNIRRVLKSSSLLAGTPLELTSTRYYDMYLVFKYMFEAAMYRGRGFLCFAGRNTSCEEISNGMTVIVGILSMIGNYGEEEDRHIKHFIKYSLYNDELIARAKAACPLYQIKLLNEILSDREVSAENDIEMAHAWFTGDRATQHRGDYAFALSMPSSRHPNYECINHANVRGWYTGDGALYLYTKNYPEGFDGVNFMCNENVAYRIPGTTVDTRERAAVSISSGWKPSTDIVGCMQFDGKYITAGMDYESYHVEKEEQREDKGYGGANPYHLNDLVARKAYFMFDKECVCLGAGINSTMDSPVITVVDHRALVSASEADGKIMLGDEIMPSSDFEWRGRAEYARVGGAAGFVFPCGADVYASRYSFDVSETVVDDYSSARQMREDAEKYAGSCKPFAEIRIEHGKNPQDAGYAYAVLPYVDDAALKKYAKAPEFEIISNTPACQAVRKKALGITGIVFYEAGECAGIKVDKPCLVTFSESPFEFKISVCEPTNKADSVTLTVSRTLIPKSLHERYKAECGEKTVITLDTSLSIGEAYEATFSVK